MLMYDVSAFSGAYSMTTWPSQQKATAPAYHAPAPNKVIHAAAAPRPAHHQTPPPAAKAHAASTHQATTHKAATTKVAHNAVPHNAKSHQVYGELAF